MFHTHFDATKRIWSGTAQPNVYSRETSLGRVLLQAMKKHSTNIGQICSDADIEMTYGEMYIKAIRAAQNIQRLNNRKGDVFAIVSRNNRDYIPLLIALLCLDHPINPISFDFTVYELTCLFNISKPKVVFTELDFYEKVAASLVIAENNAKIYTFGSSVDGTIAVEDLFAPTGIEDEFVPMNVDNEIDIATIMCSSGTTGLPKLVAVSHANFLSSLTHMFELDVDDICFTFNYPAWMGGLLVYLRCIFYGTTYIMTSENSSSRKFLETIKKYRVSTFPSAPNFILMMLKNDDLRNADLSSIKYCEIIAEKISPEAMKAVAEYLPNGRIIRRYGMTELTGPATGNFPGDQADSLGRLGFGVKIKIVDENGNRLGVGEDGEVCVEMPFKFGGYYGNQQATEALLDAEGFIQTGDIGHFDENGWLYMVDRRKDIIIYGSDRISPTMIEELLLKNSKIKFVCVVGIRIDDIIGELPAAVIVRNDSMGHISEQDVNDIVVEHFNDYWQLRGGVYFVESLPSTTTGKIIRRAVKEMVNSFYYKQKIVSEHP